MKNVLITGAFGQFGLVLQGLLSDKFNLHLTTYKPPPYSQNPNISVGKLDVTDADNVKSVIDKFNPNIIINCAALTDVDYCESNHDVARLVNVKGIENIIKCISKEVKIIHISTDYVFDGQLESEYIESDATHPINYYGKSKLEAENILRGSCGDWVILRSSMLYGAPLSSKQNFFSWVYDSLLKNQQINVVNNIFSNPAWMNQLAEIVFKIILLNSNGIFHYGSSDSISRFDFANKIADVFDLNPQLIKPVNLDSLDFAARRPKNTSLSNDKIISTFGLKPYSVEHCLCKIKESSIMV